MPEYDSSLIKTEPNLHQEDVDTVVEDLEAALNDWQSTWLDAWLGGRNEVDGETEAQQLEGIAASRVAFARQTAALVGAMLEDLRGQPVNAMDVLPDIVYQICLAMTSRKQSLELESVHAMATNVATCLGNGVNLNDALIALTARVAALETP